MRKWFLILIAFTMVALLSACDDDDRSFTIDQVKIDAQIQEDGTIDVRELYTYTFDGAFEGMTRSILSDMKGFKAYETDKTDPTAATDTMHPLTVEEDDDDDQLMKIYTDSKDETKRVLYEYEVHDSIDKYTDVGDVTYAFFDEENDSDLNQVDITMHLPEQAPSEAFHVFSHSDAAGSALSQTADGFHYEVPVLKEGETSEMRFIFPADQLADMEVTKTKAKGDAILKEERMLAERSAALAETTNATLPWMIGTAVLVIIAGVVLLVIHPNRYRGNKSTDELLRLVESTDPMLIHYLDKGEHLDEKSFVAGLLSLKQRGIIKLAEVPSEKHPDDTTLRFTYADEHARIDEADTYLIQWLFTEKDKQGRYFLLDSLVAAEDESEETAEEKGEQLEKHATQWRQLINNREAYQDLHNPYSTYGVFSILTVLATFGLTYYITTIDVLTQTEQWIMAAVTGAFALGVIFLNKNKWMISAYYIMSITMALFLFSETTALFVLLGLFVISWLMLVIVPARVWRDDMKTLIKAKNVAYHEFKTKHYPVGADPEQVERRLEYAIVLDAGKEYADMCGKSEELKQWELPVIQMYPLLASPMSMATMFDANHLILYSSISSSSSSGGSSSPSSTGGGGAGAF